MAVSGALTIVRKLTAAARRQISIYRAVSLREWGMSAGGRCWQNGSEMIAAMIWNDMKCCVSPSLKLLK